MKNLQSTLKLLILFLSLAVSSHAESDPFLQDDPFLSPDKDGLIPWKYRFGKDLIDDISRSGAVKLTAENTPESIRQLVPKDHEVYNLKPYFEKIHQSHKFSDKEYILYDLTTGHLITLTTPSSNTSLTFYIREKRLAQPQIITTSLTFTSVKRPKDPFMVWTQEEVQKHEPVLITSADLTTHSGIIGKITLGDTDNPRGAVELEPTLDNELLYVDYRLAVTIKPNAKHQGIDFNTGLAVFNGEPFIQPIGISSDPERITIMTLLARTTTAEGIPTSPEKKLDGSH